ncbi:MAG: hypothetical protein E6G92_10065 [Alphaproteobacteria bacterium]|nr:MAG: hypothetical protein E6G92_10065 [Alphaproteobacteria bacterium]
MQYTDQQLIERVESKAGGFEGWKRGVYLVAVRSNADKMDAFDDKAYVFECKADGQRPDFAMVATCTTNAGSYGLKKFDKDGLPGCAVLKADTIVYDSHHRLTHKGYKAYRQVKSFPYFRDSDKDDRAEQLGPEKSGVILANIHRASPARVSSVIYNWSVACIVLNNPNQFNALMAFANERPVSLCILQEF